MIYGCLAFKLYVKSLYFKAEILLISHPNLLSLIGGTLMPKLDIEFVRSQFPAFAETALENFIHIENAGGTYACGQMIDALADFYKQSKVQPYYGFEPSNQAGEKMSLARARLASWLNVRPNEVHFGPSTSQNTYVIGQAMRNYLGPADEIIVTNQDHEANIGAWRKLEGEGVLVKEWQVNPFTGELETNDLINMLSDNTRFVAFTHCSNIVGSINPAGEWIRLIHEAGALAFVDGVSYAGHGLPDIGGLDADIYFFSLYKVYGPHLGVMVMKNDLNQALPNQGHYFNHGSPNARFTPAGPDHAQIASVNGVIDYFDTIYSYHYDDMSVSDSLKSERINYLFKNAEQKNMIPLLEFLSDRKGVNLLGKVGANDRAPTISFTIEGKEPADVAELLANEKIGVANGNCYATRLMDALEIPLKNGVVRLSFVHYTSEKEINKVINALDRIL